MQGLASESLALATTDPLSPAVAGAGLGVALAGSPGPVQAILLTEAIRGGIGRGFRALAGANVTFGVLLAALALGLSFLSPTGPALRILQIVGGGFLLWLAIEGFRSSAAPEASAGKIGRLPPSVRGALAVILNPGAWLFLAAVASPLFGQAARTGGRPAALVAALALIGGLALGDTAIVLVGGLGLRRAGDRVGIWIRRVLALVLAGFGIWLVVTGIVG